MQEMAKNCSLKKNGEFRRVYNKGKSFADKNLVMYCLANKHGCNRLGLSISKKVGGAVVRNKVRRRVKECYRLISLKQGHDLIVIARQGSGDASFTELQKSVVSLLKRHALLTNRSVED